MRLLVLLRKCYGTVLPGREKITSEKSMRRTVGCFKLSLSNMKNRIFSLFTKRQRGTKPHGNLLSITHSTFTLPATDIHFCYAYGVRLTERSFLPRRFCAPDLFCRVLRNEPSLRRPLSVRNTSFHIQNITVTQINGERGAGVSNAASLWGKRRCTAKKVDNSHC